MLNAQPVINQKTITVVLLAYNEEDSIPWLLVEIDEFFLRKQDQFFVEILIVDDGSQDETRKRAIEATLSCPIKIVSHEKNLGYGSALSSGLMNARGDYALIMDGDGQYCIDDFDKLFSTLYSQDLVLCSGYRHKRADNILRRLNGFAWTFLMDQTLGHSLSDIDCGMKLLRLNETRPLLPLRATGAFAWTELVFLLKEQKLTIAESAVGHRPRKSGVSSGNNLSVILRAIREWISFMWAPR